MNKAMAECPVCAASEWKRRYKIGQWNIEECAACGFAKINPLPLRQTRPGYYSEEKVVQRNEKKKTAAQNISRALKSFFKKAANLNKSGIFYNKLYRYLPPGAKVLDVACGDGSFLKLAKKQFICSGIEISEYLASLARRDSALKIMTDDFLTADFGNEKYEGITLISLLEHLDDPEGALKKCFALINKGGVLLLKTVNYACLNRRIRKENWTGFRPPDHIVYFSPSNLKRMLKRIGFSKIKVWAWAFNDNMYCDAWK